MKENSYHCRYVDDKTNTRTFARKKIPLKLYKKEFQQESQIYKRFNIT